MSMAISLVMAALDRSGFYGNRDAPGNKISWTESPGAAGGLPLGGGHACTASLPLGCTQQAPNTPAQDFVTAPGSSFLQGPVSEPIFSFSLRQLFTFLFV